MPPEVADAPRRTLHGRNPVNETQRILALPVKGEFDIPDLTPLLRLPSGKMSLRPVQNEALFWAARIRGLLGSIGVGEGKTLISLLIPVVCGFKNPILMIPPSLREKTWKDFHDLRRHWKIPQDIKVIAYSELSVANGATLLDRLDPDAVICDEVHHLRNLTASRTMRFIRFFQRKPQCRFFGMSGTLTSKQLQDLSHLAELALRDGSPIPSEHAELTAWGEVLNVDGQPGPSDWGMFRPVHDVWSSNPARWEEGGPSRRESCRNAFQRRFSATPGVVSTQTASVGAALNLATRKPLVPPEVKNALEVLADTWATPDGEEEFTTALELARNMSHMSCGFWYRWRWEDVTDDGLPDDEWLFYRRNVHRALREELQPHTARENLDSPLLLFRACAFRDKRIPEHLQQAYDDWKPYKDRPVPPTEAVWISDFIVRDAITWGEKQDSPVIAWFQYSAIADKLKEARIPVYGSGQEPPEIPTTQITAMSIQAHGTGKNLQHGWSNQLIICPFGNGARWEQLLGRTHRPGQQADEVWAWINIHTAALEEAIAQAKADAAYIQETQGVKQKLSYATWILQNFSKKV